MTFLLEVGGVCELSDMVASCVRTVQAIQGSPKTLLSHALIVVKGILPPAEGCPGRFQGVIVKACALQAEVFVFVVLTDCSRGQWETSWR